MYVSLYSSYPYACIWFNKESTCIVYKILGQLYACSVGYYVLYVCIYVLNLSLRIYVISLIAT